MPHVTSRPLACFTVGALVCAVPSLAAAIELSPAPAHRGSLAVQSGHFQIAKTTAPKHVCPKGEAGRRRQTAHVRFSPPFAHPPAVSLSLTHMDNRFDRNDRYSLHYRQLSRHGMVLVFETWCDTHIYEARGHYMAIGSVAANSAIISNAKRSRETADHDKRMGKTLSRQKTRASVQKLTGDQNKPAYKLPKPTPTTSQATANRRQKPSGEKPIPKPATGQHGKAMTTLPLPRQKPLANKPDARKSDAKQPIPLRIITPTNKPAPATHTSAPKHDEPMRIAPPEPLLPLTKPHVLLPD